MSIYGAVDRVVEGSIEGWVSSKEPARTVFRLRISGIPIRAHRAELKFHHDPSKRRFKFPIGQQLHQKLPHDGVIEVIHDGKNQALPFEKGVGSIYPGKALDQGEELKGLLADKWSIDHWGNLHVTFGKDPTLLGKCIEIYTLGRALIRGVLDTELYVTGGNLLGLVREGAFLDHDDDIDASLVIRADSGEEAVGKFFDIIFALATPAKERGLRLKIAHPLHFYLIKPGLPYLDVLVGWVTRNGYWSRPSGYGGYIGVSEFIYKEVDYVGSRMAIPAHAKRELELTFGEGWHRKDDYYSKVRPDGPLKEIHRLQWKYRSRVDEINRQLEDLFEREN